uniref:Uncharacterized protein n=1 Tax=Salix viminalis TaxID=40686 RepID=A0A6N2KZY2_SALVM
MQNNIKLNSRGEILEDDAKAVIVQILNVVAFVSTGCCASRFKPEVEHTFPLSFSFYVCLMPLVFCR